MSARPIACRKALAFWIGLLAPVLYLSSSPGGARAADARPNILYIMSDDHGYQAISAYGSQLIDTPNIDRIAKAGVRFDRLTCYPRTGPWIKKIWR